MAGARESDVCLNPCCKDAAELQIPHSQHTNSQFIHTHLCKAYVYPGRKLLAPVPWVDAADIHFIGAESVLEGLFQGASSALKLCATHTRTVP